MIKRFEEFVLECYNKKEYCSVNEAFQSGKLREIIKQHGKPKFYLDNKILYDLKDNEIVDVVANRDEYWKNWIKYGKQNKEVFMVELEDGSCLIIGNLELFKEFDKKYGKESFESMRDYFNRKRSERHVGNQGTRRLGSRAFSNDNIEREHNKKVESILKRRLIEKVKQNNIQEIVDEIKSILEDIDIEKIDYNEDSYNKHEVEYDFNLNGDKCIITVFYKTYWSESYQSHGVDFADLKINLEGFNIYMNDGEYEDIIVTNDELEITPKTQEKLFADIEHKKLDIGIYDYYEAYGLNPDDFV